MIYIGIDCGDNTGFAVWDSVGKRFLKVETLRLHQALAAVLKYRDGIWYKHQFIKREITVVFEDARQRRWLPVEQTRADYRGKLMGAGSVKRDAKIWQEFCEDYKIPFEAVPPRPGRTKWKADYFARVTGWEGRTSEHARDAAILVFQR